MKCEDVAWMNMFLIQGHAILDLELSSHDIYCRLVIGHQGECEQQMNAAILESVGARGKNSQPNPTLTHLTHFVRNNNIFTTNKTFLFNV